MIKKLIMANIGYQYRLEFMLSQIYDLSIFIGDLKLAHDILTLIMNIRSQYCSMITQINLDLDTCSDEPAFRKKDGKLEIK
jgi:hypothetical protein